MTIRTWLLGSLSLQILCCLPTEKLTSYGVPEDSDNGVDAQSIDSEAAEPDDTIRDTEPLRVGEEVRDDDAPEDNRNSESPDDSLDLVQTDDTPGASNPSANGDAMAMLPEDSQDAMDSNDPAQTPPPATSCALGVLSFDRSKCFVAATNLLPWQEAERQCVDGGGHLARVDSPQDDQLVGNLILANIWLGASDTIEDNVWVWSDGTPVLFGNWGPGQPDDFLGPDCVEKRLEPLRRWFDQPCGDPHRFVCEVPAL